MTVSGNDSSGQGKGIYEAPSIRRLGLFHVETRNVCVFGKQWGGHDSFAGIVGVPIGNCSG